MNTKTTFTEKRSFSPKVFKNNLMRMSTKNSASQNLPTVKNSHILKKKSALNTTYKNVLNSSIYSKSLNRKITNFDYKKDKDQCLKESFFNLNEKQLENRMCELEVLKEKEYKYFYTNHVKELDMKQEQLEAELQYEKNRNKMLNTKEKKLNQLGTTGIRFHSQLEKTSEELISDIFYSTKQLETLEKNNMILKQRLKSIKSRTYNIQMKNTNRKNDNKTKQEEIENKKRIVEMRDKINKLNQDIKKTKRVIKKQDEFRKKEKEDIQMKIKIFEHFFNKSNCKKNTLRASDISDSQSSLEFHELFKCTLTHMLNESHKNFPMYIKVKLEILLKKTIENSSMLRTHLDNSNINTKTDDSSSLSIPNKNDSDKKSLFYRQLAKSSKESNNQSNKVHSLNNFDHNGKITKKAISSVNLDLSKKKQNNHAHSLNNPNKKNNSTNKNTIEIYKARFKKNKPQTSGFLGDDKAGLQGINKKKSKRESLLSNMIHKNISDLSFFDHIRGNQNLLKQKNSNKVGFSNLSDSKDSTKKKKVVYEAMKENQLIATDSIDSEFARRTKTSKFSERPKSPKSRFYEPYKIKSNLNKHKQHKKVETRIKQDNLLNDKPSFPISNNSSDKFVLGEEYFRNQWLHSRSIQSFNSKLNKDQSLQGDNDEDTQTVFTNFIND